MQEYTITILCIIIGLIIILSGMLYILNQKSQPISTTHEPFTNPFMSTATSVSAVSELFDNEVDTTAPIPPIIIQTWKHKELDDLVHFTCQRRIKELHPKYLYLFFDDTEMYEFVKINFPQFWSQFEKIKYKIQQIDIFRLLAVYFYGGIYLDMDIWLFKSLDELRQLGSLIFPIEFKTDNRHCKIWQSQQRFMSIPCDEPNKRLFTLGNYGFAASKKHPILKKMIENVFATYDSISKEIGTNHKDYHLVVYKTTGPDKITELYYKYPDIQNAITIIENPQVSQCCQFGIYGRHVATGTWK